MSGQEQPDDTEMVRAIMSAIGDDIERSDPGAAVAKGKPKLRVVASGKAAADAPRRPARPAPESGNPRPDAEAGVAGLADGDHAEPAGPGRLSELLGRWRPMWPYLGATLAPVPLLLLAATFGGVFSFLALMWMTGIVYAIDEIAKQRGIDGPDPQVSGMADRLSVLLGAVHFGLLGFGLFALSGGTGLGVVSWLMTLLAYGLWFGQISNSNAHELIHRSKRSLFRLGMWIYISLLFGHHTSAHRLVHHRWVATTDDPNTATEGESFYRFALRAWPAAFVAGYEMEENQRARRGEGGAGRLNPYTIYMAGAAGFLALVLTVFGFDGLLAYLLLCAYAQMQLLLSDYVQHYGLLRKTLPSGALEPAGLHHSWDAPHPLSGAMMLNAPRHSDHHAHPSRPYTELRLSPAGQAPMLPYSLPVMATIALVPSAWHRIMDKRLARVRARA